MTLRKDLHEENRAAWNAATDAHNSHKADQARFFREGGSTLYPEEIELLGEVAGKRLLHLQCNAGQDTLSLAQRGAVVTGVDISDTAINFARRLAAEAGIPAVFHRADIYDWLETTAESFDIVFSSYGALVWLSDIRLWGRGIAKVLKPGGRFALVEFHPFISMYDEDFNLVLPYFGQGQPQTFESGIGDYVAVSGAASAPSGYLEGVQNFANPHRSHEFAWGIGEVVTALVEAGLTLTALREYPYSNGFRPFHGMREMPGGRMVMPEGKPDLPLMYGLAAEKPQLASG
jgi:SAM-dependent methyltransferase